MALGLRARVGRLRSWIPGAILVALALFIAWAFASTTLFYGGRMGLPLDDSYGYLTYAKQFGRAQPFTYFPGGGFSAESTSVLWPMLLAPFWTLGARGDALVWVAFGLGAVLYAAVAAGIYRFVREVSGRSEHASGFAAAAMALAIAPFAFGALSGLEVGLTAALLVATLLTLARANDGSPSWRLVACLSALGLTRPDAMVLVGLIVVLAVSGRLRRRAWRDAARWLVPLVLPLLWLVIHRVLAGHWLPRSAHANGELFAMVQGLFVDGRSPLVWPLVVLALFVVGCVRIALWSRREHRVLAGVVVIVAPFVMVIVASVSSPLWTSDNYRSVAPALPLLFIPLGVALIPVKRVAGSKVLRSAWPLAVLALAIGFAVSARASMMADMRLFAQGALDNNTQGVKIGSYVRRKLPAATVMSPQTGAIAFYSDARIVELQDTSEGPGTRFEYLERLPIEQRPTHLAIYASSIAAQAFVGDVLLHTPLRRAIDLRRFATDSDVQLITASWDLIGTAERPLNDHTGWALVDRVDVADLVSERAHDWRGPLEPRSVVEKSTRGGLAIDGGRTIRAGREQFTVHIDPAKPTRVVLRTGGQPGYPGNEAIKMPVDVTLRAGKKKFGMLTVAPPAGAFSELAFNLPPYATKTGTLSLRTEASGTYRVFHWFVLQPE